MIKKVTFTEYNGSKGLLGFATIEFSIGLIVKEISLRKNDNYYITMPSKKKKDGTYMDIVFPLNKELRTIMTEAVVKAYESTLNIVEEEKEVINNLFDDEDEGAEFDALFGAKEEDTIERLFPGDTEITEVLPFDEDDFPFK